MQVETNNLVVCMAINGELTKKNDHKLGDNFWTNVKNCRVLIKKKNVRVSQVPRELNRGADYLVNHAAHASTERYQNIKKGLKDLDEAIISRTWEAIFGASQVVVTALTNAQEEQRLIDNVEDPFFYEFSQSDRDAKIIIHWIDTGIIS